MKKTEEEKYIHKRKLKALRESLVYRMCHVFPVKSNKIVMWTFEGGGGYACSPKYIAEEILRRNELGQTDYVIYWLVKDMNKSFPDGIIKVKDSIWNRAYHLSTARFWVSNTRTFLGTFKRKETTYIQTWHGSISLKPIGKLRGNLFSKMAYIVSESDSDLMDYAISGSRWCTKMWPDGLVYNGKILEIGSPRCDVLIDSVKEKHEQLRMEYHIPKDAKICLYAPTFRGGSQDTKRSVNTEPVSIDFIRLISTLEKCFGGTWYVFLRLHPQLAAQLEELPVSAKNDRMIDVSQRPDMAEIMAATDCIITDYSTVIFEGFLTGQPGFIYADDLDEYVADRGKLMFDLDEIPFTVARDNDTLMKNIESFNKERYEITRTEFIKKTGIVEDGHASERVVDLIENKSGASCF